MTHGVVETREQQAAERAHAYMHYLDGIEGATLAFHPDSPEAQSALDLARRGRLIARDLLRTLQQLEAERSARVAVQQARDRLLEMLGDK